MSNTEYKYSCDLCNFNTLYISEWNKHINTDKHKRDGTKKQTKCSICNYISNTHWNLKMHILTQHSTKEQRIEQKYYCTYCDQVFFCSQYLKTHINGKKHLSIISAIENYNK
jgi:hypothetical protein